MPSPSSQPRTNSLAFAKTDCHTCIANHRQCDRNRPRCSSCSSKNIVCGGYPMQLTWSRSRPIQPSAAVFSEQTDGPFYLDPLSLQASIHIKERNSRSRPHKPRKFRFVAERTTGRKQSSSSATELCEHRIEQNSASPGAAQAPASIQKANIVAHQCPLSSLPPNTIEHDSHAASPSRSNELSNMFMPFPNDFSSDLLDWWSCSSTGIIENPGMIGEHNNYYDTAAMSSTIENIAVESSSPTLLFIDPRQILMPLSSPILHNNLFEKFKPILNMYDQEFCVVPLSGDIPSNPFRCRPETSRGSPSLLHSILAVSCYHAGRRPTNDHCLPLDVVGHHNTAIKLYRDELDTYTGTQGLQLLDTTMVLFLFHATQSAFSNWSTHISDARRILRQSGGVETWVDNPRVQAQVVMLLWWDATIALLSRQGCLLPYSYFESLLALEDNRYWTFFDLIGCPKQLVISLMQLTSLVEENKKVSSMDWTKYDSTLVDEIQASIINWNNPSPEIDDEILEEQMQQERDRWNCTEAWRYGLLIYITRVFRWNRNTSPPSRLAIYSRHILEHVNSCRHTAIVQKQAFFPLFLAGCETRDQCSRQSIRDYCQYWDKNSGYDLFSTASSLLEDVWMEQDGPCGNEAWWGSVIDKKQQPYQSHITPLQFCFG